MLSTDDLLNLEYYKKDTFSGWINGMRFLVKKESQEDTGDSFHAWLWPGPFIFDLTEDEKKIDFTAPFTEEGKAQVVDWINEQYKTRGDLWNREKKVLL